MNQILEVVKKPYVPRVKYLEFIDDKKYIKRGGFYAGYHACFASIYYGGGWYDKKSPPFNPHKIIYFGIIDESLSKEQVEFYLDFLNKILDNNLFKYKFGKSIKVRKVIYQLNTKGLNRVTSLLYLTAFRYVQEFPEIIVELHKFASSREKEKDIEELFIEFQRLHYSNCIEAPILKKYNALGGHGLVFYQKMWGSTTNTKIEFQPINLKKFKKNITDEKITLVHNFFK